MAVGRSENPEGQVCGGHNLPLPGGIVLTDLLPPPFDSYGPGIWMTVIVLFHSPCIESCFKKWVGLVGWNFWVVRLERLVLLCYVC